MWSEMSVVCSPLGFKRVVKLQCDRTPWHSSMSVLMESSSRGVHKHSCCRCWPLESVITPDNRKCPVLHPDRRQFFQTDDLVIVNQTKSEFPGLIELYFGGWQQRNTPAALWEPFTCTDALHARCDLPSCVYSAQQPESVIRSSAAFSS